MTSTSLELDLVNIVGFRFHPSDEELVNHYLKRKMLGFDHEVSKIAEVDVCKFEPWELPGHSEIKTEDPVWWYFFSPRSYKYMKSKRANRTTKAGYWKVTGKDRKISTDGNKEEIATKKTLVFYEGRVPNGVKTSWIMHEYHPNFNFPNQKDFVLCKLKNEAGHDVPTLEDESSVVVGLDEDQSLNESNDIHTFGEGDGPSMTSEPRNYVAEEDSQLVAYLKSFQGCDETDYSLSSALDYQTWAGEASSSSYNCYDASEVHPQRRTN